MYQAHFGFEQLPFTLTPNTDFFYGLAPHFEAIQTVISALDMGEGVIKVTGEVGTGKTMVCRMLVNHLKDCTALIYLPNPVLSGTDLRHAVAKELDLTVENEASLVDNIQHKLIELHNSGLRVVAIIDEAQALSDEALETLRLFGNLETEDKKLLQIVLLGQPELDARLEAYHLRQFRQRITFSSILRALTLDETVAYIDNRIAKSGGSPELFSLNQKKAICRSSQGIPRLINQLCHKALLLSFSESKKNIDNQHLFSAMHETYDVCKPKFKTPILWGWN
ncbi:MSHA biogenesis protein MshM [Vibrio chagasii]|uniref:ExeA family protein n=1 Tax=Vibrio splendidus TaxID=29497 RepID=UPI000E327A9D|nr:AAA family ATPase [Vibrio splendidus]CAH6998138.1 MSHA biogenesis protein MshM [Vibrio chagasii]CAH7012031.1 MSHA biogenesis protein MshM [Vibrio chagasii]CAH7165700.1 MSHA biogenesis protein MshM [Vibrio chagasii]CAH7344390.1 MSHA biogenesis protein MshM [Vibrio chagasii]CAH7446908.1 MSHA biogenesis protein MshM [Vibrio chagasii]